MARLVATAVILALGLSACTSMSQRDPKGTTTRGFYSPNFDVVWDTAETALKNHHYVVDRENSSREAKTLVSRWNTQLHPFSHKGTREQATVYLHEVEGNPNHYTTEVNVVRQTNVNLKEPGNPTRAQWANDERVPETESRISHEIEVFFLGYDVSPEFRARYGMPSGPREIPAPAPTGGDTGAPTSTK